MLLLGSHSPLGGVGLYFFYEKHAENHYNIKKASKLPSLQSQILWCYSCQSKVEGKTDNSVRNGTFQQKLR